MHISHLRLTVPLALLLALSLATETLAASNCKINAYSIDKDPAGLNVRAGPGTNYKVIARLKRVNDGGYFILPEFQVLATQKRWLLIGNAQQGLDGKPLFEGRGWVHASRVATMTRGYESGHVNLRRERSMTSATIIRAPRETEVGLRGCHGGWALVEYKGKRGWLAPADQCGTSATTCN